MADLASTKVYGTLDVSDELNVSGEANINQMNGNSSTASKLETARTITINGVISGSTSFDGSSNVTLTTSHTSDPVISLTGDVTGSGTMTNLGNVSITATVADDSHNHIISNVDGLQTALDSKLITSNNLSDLTNAATARSNLGVDASGTVNYSHPTYNGDDINLDTGSLTGATVISDLDFNVTTDTLGHVTDANATYSTRNITLANLGFTGDIDANNYSLPVASTTLGGIKSGTDITVDGSGNVSVNNDSHTHDSRYYTETESDNRFIIRSTEHEYEVVIAGGVSSVTYGYKIKTNISVGSKMCRVRIDACQDSYTNSTFALLSWYYYNGSVYSPKYISFAAGDPLSSFQIGVENNKFVIFINDPGYYSSFRVSYLLYGSHQPSISELSGWSWADEAKLNSTFVQASGGVAWSNGNDGSESGLDADKLDGQHGSYYRDWANITGKPSTFTPNTENVQDIVGSMVSGNSESGISVVYQDADGTLDFNVNDPVISLTGGVTGSGTMTNLGNVSITATVTDDSHNHVISNIDGLQTALDNKLNSSSYTASDVLTKIKTVDGSGSGLDADTLDGQHGSYYSHSISGSKSSATT
jgi:hypothetical protein